VAEFDRRRGWELGGHRSCAHWLSFRTGIDLGAAREKARTARALVDLPRTAASMSRGELSFSAVRALTRVATRAGSRAGTPRRRRAMLCTERRTANTLQLKRFRRTRPGGGPTLSGSWPSGPWGLGLVQCLRRAREVTPGPGATRVSP
jgi:hypothetical protein